MADRIPLIVNPSANQIQELPVGDNLVGINSITATKLTVVDNSSSNALRITQTGTGNALVVEDEANPDSTPVVIASDGRVGIGTIDPSDGRFPLSFTSLVISGPDLSTRQGITIAGNISPGIAFYGKSAGTSGDSLTGSITYTASSNIMTSLSDSQGIQGRYFMISPGGGAVVAISSERLITSSTINIGIGTTNPTSKLHVIGDARISGVVTATTINDSNGNVRAVPQNSKTSSYTLISSDSGKHISITTGGVTVPASVFSVGDVVTIYNDSTNNQSIIQGSSTTLRLAGSTTTGNRTLSGYGLCTILCVSSNVFVISGSGLS